MTYRQFLDQTNDTQAAMAYDAVLRNLAVIGEAVRTLPAEFTASMPNVPWAAIAGLRNVVIHEYFRVDSSLIIDIVDSQLAPLAAQLRRVPLSD
ncbi:HepT-like ribonuclease domain-containing protein [Agromyces marinus]|uniref:HepT-like ribonuclease domain-containing protein n=1 Tax=Agromyces marinus TaxID=1389020 RepID=UPI003D9AFFF7